MLSPHNILSPAQGRPLVTPSQDIVLGCHYLTKQRGEITNPRAAEAGLAADDPRRLRVFHSPTEGRAAYDNAEIGLHGQIALRAASGGLARPAGGPYIVATAGGGLVNEGGPQELGFINQGMGKKG